MVDAAATFNPIIHAPHRLRICAMLLPAQGLEFAEVQERVELSKSALSKQLTQLVDAGYVAQDQVVRARRSRLVLSLTETGRAAYLGHIAALEEIISAGVPSRAE